MPPRKGTRTKTTPATVTSTTPIIDAAIRALIAQGVADALAEQEIQRNTNLNGDGSQGSGSGVVGLTQWFERMETVFHISNYAVENQVKFATCTLLGAALIRWNSHVKTVGHDAAYGMPWKTLIKMMTVKYCQRSEIKKLEIKIWNLKVKATDVVGYTQRFQELTLMCGRMFPEESDEVEKYVGGLPDMIQGNVMSARPKTMQEAIELANDLMDQKNVGYKAYGLWTGERKEYAGTLPLCNKCKFHHNGPCTAKCANCKKVGHLTRDCWNPTATSNQRTITCYECGNQGHYKSDCPELKNRNHGNQAEGTEARGMVYALGGGETNQDLDDMEDDINA
ncbi:reverse transcriptase domain-containing protein [Tanacetum coccineum]